MLPSLEKEHCYTFSFPTTIHFGNGTSRQLPSYLEKIDKKKPLIVTDPICAALPFFKEITEQLKSEGFQIAIFSKIDKNPKKVNVVKGSQQFHSKGCDSIIGVGGGASLDVAKAIALITSHEGDLFDYEECVGGEKLIVDKLPHLISIPTTAGTGSEVGRSCVISDDITHEKKIIFSPYLLSKVVFADPLLTKELPSGITAATGMDALTHHLEAYFSKGFHPLCDAIAIEGIRIIWEHLETATNDPTEESRSYMMIAALMGAIAFQKGLGVVHSAAHALSSLYDIHHGLANGVMLYYGVLFNREVCKEKINYIEKILSIDSLPEKLYTFNQKLKIPNKLKDLGVKKEDLEKLSEIAFADSCHQCNPRQLSKEDFLTLYQDAL